MSSITIQHIEDLKNTRTPLTIVTGVGEKIAVKLSSGGIITVMALSVCDPKRLVPLGLTEYQAKTIVKAAQDIVDTVSGGGRLDMPSNSEVQNVSKRTVVLNGREVEITKKDFEEAEMLGIPVEDLLLMDSETRAMELRIVRSLVTVNAPEVDHGAEEFDLGIWNAPDFVKSRDRAQIDASQRRGIQRAKTLENTASFVKDIVHGEDIHSGGNVNKLAVEANTTPTKEELESEVYIPNRRQTETRLESKKKQSDSIKMIIDELL